MSKLSANVCCFVEELANVRLTISTEVFEFEKARVSECVRVCFSFKHCVRNNRHRNRLRFGIELRQPRGAHEGVHGGVRYFRCARRCAVFCGAEDILSVTVAQSKGMVGDRVLVRGFGEGVIRFIGDSAEQRGYLKYGIESLAPRARKRFVFVDRAKIAKVLQKCAAKHRRYDVVEVDGYGMGVVRFIGTIPEIPDDVSYGVDLDRAVGKNNGSLNGRRYLSQNGSSPEISGIAMSWSVKRQRKRK